MNCLGKAAHKGSTLYFFCVSVLLQGSCNAARNAIFFTYVSLVIKGLQQSCEQKIFRYDLSLWNLGNFRAFWNDVVGCSATKYAWHLRCMHSFEHSQLWKPSKLSDFWAKRDPSRRGVSGRSMETSRVLQTLGRVCSSAAWGRKGRRSLQRCGSPCCGADDGQLQGNFVFSSYIFS